ncbi:MAG: hypothetical protein KF914_12430 [Rhizobiaceae bacterium]|nr:hypothetical protein [Rhizobiaceae bacterium]
MKSILLAAAFTGLAFSAAQAECNYHKSVSAEQIDKTTVASVVLPQPAAPAGETMAPAEDGEK